MNWFEELPDQCPPSEAIEPDNEVFCRAIEGDSAESSDFLSQREICGNDKVFEGVSECIARSVSLSQNIQGILKLPRFKGKKFVEIELKKEDGLILQTFKKSHYSWWRSQNFDFQNVKIARNE
jgi:hypothetical protein